jgi:hypothetical protein
LIRDSPILNNAINSTWLYVKENKKGLMAGVATASN